MKCPSKKTQDTRPKTQDPGRGGFTLVESLAATALLAFIGASIWVVMERCSISAADTTQRMRAFEIARDNMENMLATTEVEETTEYGVNEQFPDIRWQTTIESFYEPVSSRTWVRAVCGAEYTDATGETQSVELTHWLTDLTDEQIKELMERKELQEKLLEKHLIESEKLAAEYAGVPIETIREWVKNGMPRFEGHYLKPWLDLFLQTDGKPMPEEMQMVLDEFPEMSIASPKKLPAGQQTPAEFDPTNLPEDLDPVLREKNDQLFGN